MKLVIESVGKLYSDKSQKKSLAAYHHPGCAGAEHDRLEQ